MREFCYVDGRVGRYLGIMVYCVLVDEMDST